MAERVGDGVLKVQAILLAFLEDVLIDPLVDGLGINLEGPDESCEEFDAPWVSEDGLHVRDIHTELVSKAALHFKWELAENTIHGGDSLVAHGNLGKVWVLEVPVVRFFSLATDSLSLSSCVVPFAGLKLGNFTFSKEGDLAFKFILDCALDVPRGADVLDIDNGAFVLLTRDLEVNINTHLTVSDDATGDVKAAEHFLELADDQFGVVGVSFLWLSVNLEKRDTRSVEVDQELVVLLNSRCGVLNTYTSNQTGLELLPAPSGLSQSERSSPGLCNRSRKVYRQA